MSYMQASETIRRAAEDFRNNNHFEQFSYDDGYARGMEMATTILAKLADISNEKDAA